MSTAIEAHRLTYAVGRATLVAGVDIAARQGEMVAVIGPNGAGKSTLIRLLCGDLRGSDGSVALDGEPVVDLAPAELALRRAVMSQGGVPDVPFTVEAVVAMGRYPHRRVPDNTAARDREAIATALRQTDAARLAGRVYATLSGGEKTRVTLARVLAQEAPVLLLDEPTAALDVAHEEMVMRLLRSLVDRGRAVVIVLHDLNTAAHYADRLVLLHGGRILAEGPPPAVLTESTLHPVYGPSLRVVPHPFRECPLVLVAD